MTEIQSIPTNPLFKDLTGKSIGLLTVLYYCGIRPKPCGQPNHLWMVKCECGNTKIMTGGNLKGTGIVSCGCYKTKKLNTFNHSHGMSRTPTWNSWSMMIQRCTDENFIEYHRYGGRGIAVCDRWKDFCNFLADMGTRPAGTSIDRFPNNNGNYEPGNCRWATSKQQGRNKRTSRLISHNGKTKTLMEWSEETGISCGRISQRIKTGWTIAEALSITPVIGRNQTSHLSSR